MGKKPVKAMRVGLACNCGFVPPATLGRVLVRGLPLGRPGRYYSAMLTGPFSLNQQTPASRPAAPLAFDPRPWPLVVLMLAGLLGVYFALRPASAGDGQSKEAAAGQRLGIAVPALADAKQTLEQGITLTFQQGGK